MGGAAASFVSNEVKTAIAEPNEPAEQGASDDGLDSGLTRQTGGKARKILTTAASIAEGQ